MCQGLDTFKGLDVGGFNLASGKDESVPALVPQLKSKRVLDSGRIVGPIYRASTSLIDDLINWSVPVLCSVLGGQCTDGHFRQLIEPLVVGWPGLLVAVREHPELGVGVDTDVGDDLLPVALSISNGLLQGLGFGLWKRCRAVISVLTRAWRGSDSSEVSIKIPIGIGHLYICCLILEMPVWFADLDLLVLLVGTNFPLRQIAVHQIQ